MLQTWDQDTGNPMVQLGDLLYKFMGTASVGWSFTGGAQSGTIVDGRFTQFPGCEAFAFAIDCVLEPRGGGLSLTIEGNTLTWRYPYADAVSWKRPNVTFVYGIY